MTAWTGAAQAVQTEQAAQAAPAEQAAPAAPAMQAAHRQSLLARKIVAKLFFVQHHPLLPVPLRQVMAQARQRWLALAHTGQAHAAIDCSSGAPHLH